MMIIKSVIAKSTLIAGLALAACSPRLPRCVVLAPDALRKEIRAGGAPLTLVHAWATWCQPCREEFPSLLAAYDRYRHDGLRLILVSADTPGELEAVARFLSKQHSPVGSLVATELSQTFIETLSTNWSGALPASFFFDPAGRLIAEHEGRMSETQYVEQIESLLKNQRREQSHENR